MVLLSEYSYSSQVVGVRLYSVYEGKQLGIALEQQPVACRYWYGRWHLLYKAKQK